MKKNKQKNWLMARINMVVVIAEDSLESIEDAGIDHQLHDQLTKRNSYFPIDGVVGAEVSRVVFLGDDGNRFDEYPLYDDGEEFNKMMKGRRNRR